MVKNVMKLVSPVMEKVTTSARLVNQVNSCRVASVWKNVMSDFLNTKAEENARVLCIDVAITSHCLSLIYRVSRIMQNLHRKRREPMYIMSRNIS